jgi:ATP/maltotriose-dependent transcriptional regulator MalT
MNPADKPDRPNYYAFSPKLTCILSDIFNLPMTVITSPKGYGKQLAVSAYILNTNAVSFWLNIEQDTDINGFFAYFADILCTADNQADPEFPRLAPDLRLFVNVIREFTAGQNGRETVVVIDNFQNIQPDSRAGTLDLLFGIASSFIQRFHIVLLSDCLLPFHGGKYRSEFVREIGKPLLKLDETEIAAFLGFYGISVTETEIKKAVLFSEGWLYALSSLIVASLEAGRFDDGVIETAGRYMFPYIYDSFWNSLQKPERDFITVMAAEEAFTPEQAGYACRCCGAEADPEAILRHLLNNNCLIDYDAASGTYRFHNLLRKLAEREARGAQSAGLDLSLLSERETEVCGLLREGKTYQDIGRQLYISVNTVKTNTKNIYRKLGIRGRRELTNQA